MMLAVNKRKTLIERVIESLPDQLRRLMMLRRGGAPRPTRY